VEGHGNAAVSLLASFGAGLIDQDTAHEAGREAVKVFAIFKAEAALADEFEKELIDDAGGLEEVFWSLAAKEGARDISKLGINKLEEVLNGRRVARVPIAEKYRDFTRFRHDE
jgi:hypothetical protein